MMRSVAAANNLQKVESLTKAFVGSGAEVAKDPFLNEEARSFHKLIKSLELKEGDKVLYIGTGSGYGTFIISNLVGKTGEVHSYERDEKAMGWASSNIMKAGNPDNVHLIMRDAFESCNGALRFDKVLIVTGAPFEKKDMILNNLLKQANPDCIIVLPLGQLCEGWNARCQGSVYKIKRWQGKTEVSKLNGILDDWYPMTGRYGFPEKEIQRVMRSSVLDDFL